MLEASVGQQNILLRSPAAGNIVHWQPQLDSSLCSWEAILLLACSEPKPESCRVLVLAYSCGIWDSSNGWLWLHSSRLVVLSSENLPSPYSFPLSSLRCQTSYHGLNKFSLFLLPPLYPLYLVSLKFPFHD